MERLTERLENGVINVKYASQHETAIHRLVTIEDILGDEYDLDELREMAQAKREGRCVVLPCKIGQKVYDITSGEVIEKSVVSIPFLLSKSINHLCLHAINQRDAITEIGTQDFGKTVFFTRAEAETALSERG